MVEEILLAKPDLQQEAARLRTLLTASLAGRRLPVRPPITETDHGH